MELLNVLENTRKEIDKCYFALCFEMNSGLPLGISTVEYKDVAESIGAAFGQMLDIVVGGQKHARNATVREVLKEFKELILETDRSTFFIMVPENNNAIAVAVGVPQEIKLGYARVAIQKHYPALIKSIKDIT
jgi:hypothetical protein